MSKDKKEIIRQYPLIMMFFISIIVVMIADMTAKDRDFSELENKVLKQKPKFSTTSFLSNKWTAEYGEYIKEQFVLRDKWIDLYAFFEEALFQKEEIGDVLIGKDNMLFKRLFTLTQAEQQQARQNIEVMSKFTKAHPGKVTFMLVPTASLIYPENLPAQAPMYPQEEFINEVYQEVEQNAEVIDLIPVLKENKDKYIYYRTDHHWTTDGAYLAYEAYCKKKHFMPSIYKDRIQVNGFYGSHYSSSRQWHAKSDELVYYDLPNEMTVYKVLGEDSFEVENTGSLYNTKKLKTMDKYGMFLDGNNGYSTIKGNGKGNILIIKDSYANCFIPFLVDHYEQIEIIDLRNYNYSTQSLLDKNYDDILVLYNFQSFISDPFIVNLIRPSSVK